ncbi:MAG: hypothetical protein QME79_12190 [Bacillota bacterium]|nr:hypothetical protein [Bacillota bacterium]
MRPQGLFVTPHALDRFHERIDPGVSDASVYALIAGLGRRLPDYVTFRPTDPEALIYRGEWLGKVFTVWAMRGEGEWPAAITVIPGDDQLRRWLSWTREDWKPCKHGRQLRYLQKWGFSPEDCAQIIRQPLSCVLRRWEDSLGNTRWDSTVTTLGEGRPYLGNRLAVHL